MNITATDQRSRRQRHRNCTRNRKPQGFLLSGSISQTVFPAVWLVSFGGREPVAEVAAKAFKTGIHHMVHLTWPRPVRSRDLVTRHRHFSTACSVGK